MAACGDRKAEFRALRAQPNARSADQAFASGDYARAQTFAELAASYDPLEPVHQDQAHRCELAAMIAGDQTLGADRLIRADALAEAMEPIDPTYAWLYQTARGFSAFGRGDLPAAETHLIAAVKANPKFAAAHVGLGHVQLATHKIDEALESFQAAVAINPSHPGALANLGRLLLEKGRPQEAIDPLTRSLALRDSNLNRMNLAEALTATGMRVDAISQLRRVVQTEPRNAPAMLRMANLLMQMGDFVEALRVFREAQPLGGTEAVRGIAEVQVAQRDYASAEASLREVLKVAPEDLSALFLAGEVSEKLKKPADAAAWYGNYLRLAVGVPSEVARVAIAKDRIERLMPPAPGKR